MLRDPGRRPENQTPEKPAGSVHGDSVGVHASDAANAWRHIARVGSARTRMASLIVGAYHTAGQAGRVNNQPYPLTEQLEQVRATVALFIRNSAIGNLLLCALAAWLLFPLRRPRAPRRDWAIVAAIAVIVLTSLYQLFWVGSVVH